MNLNSVVMICLSGPALNEKLLLLRAHRIFSPGVNSLDINSTRSKSNRDFDYLMIMKLAVE